MMQAWANYLDGLRAEGSTSSGVPYFIAVKRLHQAGYWNSIASITQEAFDRPECLASSQST